MIKEIDIYRSAKLLIDRFEDNALDIANQRIVSFEMLENREGVSIWCKIKKAVEWELS